MNSLIITLGWLCFYFLCLLGGLFVLSIIIALYLIISDFSIDLKCKIFKHKWGKLGSPGDSTNVYKCKRCKTIGFE